MEMRSAGRYELLEEIGRGAMGVVYKATDPLIGRTVAVKMLRVSEEGTGLSRAELLARFQNEVRAAGRINHPNIVVVHDTGEEDGRFFITMEYVEGRSLQALIERRQSFPLPRVLNLLSQVCSALDTAHKRGVVHRDIKPANILLTADDTAKITDFGTAKILQIGAGQTATVMGTPSYMSPEQVKGKAVDGRSDIFSLGVILYELITGEKPFPGQNITTVIYKIVNEEPIPPSHLDASIHPGLNVVIRRALAKDPETRYQTCSEFFEALRNYRALDLSPEATQPLVTRPAPPRSAAPIRTTPAPAATLPHPRPAQLVPSLFRTAAIEPPRPQKRARPGFVLALLLAILGWTSYLAWPAFESILADSSTSVSAPAKQQPAEQAKTAAAEKAQLVNSSASQPEKSEPAESVPASAVSIPTTEKTEPPAKAGSTTTVPAIPEKLEPPKPITPGSLQILTEIPGARVILRDATGEQTMRCVTPCRFRALAPGRYALLVQKPNFRAAKQTVTISAGEAAVAQVPLEPVSAELSIVTQPAAAEIFVNGRRQSEVTPATLYLAPGNHTILVRKQGHEPAQTVVELKDRDSRRVNLELTQAIVATGWVEVRSNPAGAEILINDEPTGQKTPARLELPAGIHTLVLKLNGYAPQRRTILVEPHRTIIQSQVLPER